LKEADDRTLKWKERALKAEGRVALLERKLEETTSQANNDKKLHDGQYQIMMKIGSVMGEIVWKSFKSHSNVKMLIQAQESMLKYCALTKGIIDSFMQVYGNTLPPLQSLEHVFVISLLGSITNLAAFAEGRAFLAQQELVVDLMKKMVLDQERWSFPHYRFIKRMVLTFAYNMSLEDPVAFVMLSEEKLVNSVLRCLSLHDPTDVVAVAVAIIYRLLSSSVQAGIPSSLPEKPQYQAVVCETKNAFINLNQFNKANRKTRSGTGKQKKKLSRKEIKELGLYTLPHDTIKYKDAQKLHRMWCGYFNTLFPANECPDVTEGRYNTIVASLLKADYHGAKIHIVRSKQPSVVGMKGIVVLDTKGTFKMVSKDDKLRTIPKNDSQFEVFTNDKVVTIFGKHLNVRPAERSVKKMKTFLFPDL
uniref:Ribonuclease P protein subunit p29 n=1 Tax=Anopheles epiroticus TaxID=199890 RepID=A0A182PC54_9DIPT